MTVNDVIKHVVPVLEGIKVPMTEIQAIGIPLSGAINDLKRCIAFLNQVEEEARKEQKTPEKKEQETQAKERKEGDTNREKPDEAEPEGKDPEDAEPEGKEECDDV